MHPPLGAKRPPHRGSSSISLHHHAHDEHHPAAIEPDEEEPAAAGGGFFSKKGLFVSAVSKYLGVAAAAATLTYLTTAGSGQIQLKELIEAHEAAMTRLTLGLDATGITDERNRFLGRLRQMAGMPSILGFTELRPVHIVPRRGYQSEVSEADASLSSLPGGSGVAAALLTSTAGGSSPAPAAAGMPTPSARGAGADGRIGPDGPAPTVKRPGAPASAGGRGAGGPGPAEPGRREDAGGDGRPEPESALRRRPDDDGTGGLLGGDGEGVDEDDELDGEARKSRPPVPAAGGGIALDSVGRQLVYRNDPREPPAQVARR